MSHASPARFHRARNSIYRRSMPTVSDGVLKLSTRRREEARPRPIEASIGWIERRYQLELKAGLIGSKIVAFDAAGDKVRTVRMSTG